MNSEIKETMRNRKGYVFDERGRIQPSNTLTGAVHPVSRHYFRMQKISFDPKSSYNNVQRLISPALKESEFCARMETMMEGMLDELGISTFSEMAAVPFYLPRMLTNDLGSELLETLLPLISKSYDKTFPDYQFSIETTEPIAGQIKSIVGLGHDLLTDAAMQGDVIGICLFALGEYSVQAARQQSKLLPPAISLAGALDLSASLIARPDLLYNTRKYPPMLWMSGCETPWKHANFHFEAYGYNLNFNRRAHHDLVAEYWHHGLTSFEII